MAVYATAHTSITIIRSGIRIRHARLVEYANERPSVMPVSRMSQSVLARFQYTVAAGEETEGKKKLEVWDVQPPEPDAVPPAMSEVRSGTRYGDPVVKIPEIKAPEYWEVYVWLGVLLFSWGFGIALLITGYPAVGVLALLLPVLFGIGWLLRSTRIKRAKNSRRPKSKSKG